MSPFDTIVALITGAPPCAVAWIRISGPDSWRIASEVFSPFRPEAGRATYGRWIYGDDGLALPFAAGNSYTGEATVELSLHGSLASIRLALEACASAGARPARPGEFTERAFLNGNLDLTQAEAVLETIEALTEVQLKEAARNLQGALRSEINELRQVLLRLLAAVEASVDFSEEVGELDRAAASGLLAGVAMRVSSLRQTARVGRFLRNGVRIAIVGPPNAGKSALLNAILGEERSIVTPIAGTTRDYVEERTSFDGLPIVLIDTAGLRETTDPVEAIGIQRTRAQAAQADVVWFVYDSTQETPEVPAFGPPVRLVANKSDLATPTSGHPISALTGEGIRELLETIRPLFHRPGGPTISPRIAPLLDRAAEAIAEALSHLAADAPDDLLAVLLAEALTSLGEVTGETTSPDLLAALFGEFCIGK